MLASTSDCKGEVLKVNDLVRILEVPIDPDTDEDDLEMFRSMRGSVCEIERIDADGAAWVALWWQGDEGAIMTQIGLAPRQMEKVAA